MYLVKMPLPHVKEIVDSVFSCNDYSFPEIIGFIDRNNLDAVVFGGAIRDAIAGKELVGDMDIVTLSQSFKEILREFRRLGAVIHNDPTDPDSQSLCENEEYREWGTIDIPTDITYKGKKYQLIRCKHIPPNKTPQEVIYNVVSDVDIRCCGVMMTADGDVYETVKGAVSDCLYGELRLPLKPGYSKNIVDRITELKNRGWINKIRGDDVHREHIDWDVFGLNK